MALEQRKLEGCPETPELDKMKMAKAASQPAGEFLEWLGNRGYILTRINSETGDLVPTHLTVEHLLADWLGVDLAKAETEKRLLLDWLRSQQ